MIFNLLFVELNAGDAVVNKAMTCIVDQSHRMQQVMNHYWLEHVEFEVTLRTRKRNRGIVAEYLDCHHRHCFTLRGIDLSRHDRRARFVFRENQLTQATTRPRSEPTYVIGNLHKRRRKSLQRSAGK